MQDFNFFKTYYPTAQYLEKDHVPAMLCNMIEKQNLLIELGCAYGDNLLLFNQAGYRGKMIAYDLCQRFGKPDIPNVTLIEGDVRHTLQPSDQKIDILYLDLDQDPDVTKYALRQLSSQIADSWIYIDEFFGPGFDANTFAQWLLEVYFEFEICAYTNQGALIKIGSGNSADHLITSLDSYVPV